ncbi:MAG: succinyl-diaminopimelate desuccinylase [Gammaproteobacteria bacterium]|nr:succinyl-diaminopimelate desuccinylase [Gammaproteobacteria bacterium]
MSNALELTKQLINKPSVTPDDHGCIKTILIPRLQKLGFTTEVFEAGGATNLWARFGTAKPVICFAGHTDVVPTGPIERWTSDPFIATERDGYLYGRGAADMKAGVAAMIVAIENFIATYKKFSGSIALLITSAEEDLDQFGTPIVLEALKKRNEKIDYCIIGEPSSHQQFGDVIKNGRRGSLHGKLVIHGKQGHIASPHLADNPIHKALVALQELTSITWDQGNADFPPTSFQISNIHAGTGALNVIPNDMTLNFNFRFSPEVTAAQLEQRVTTILQQHKLKFDLQWSLSGNPFHCQNPEFTDLCLAITREISGVQTRLETGGGTSDGRFIAATGTQVVEIGLCNKTAHQIDECILIADVDKLVIVYQQILTKMLG